MSLDFPRRPWWPSSLTLRVVSGIKWTIAADENRNTQGPAIQMMLNVLGSCNTLLVATSPIHINKHLDPNLPFYNYTSTHTWYYKGDFSEPGKKTSHKNISTKNGATCRFCTKVCNNASQGKFVRQQFYNLPLELPP